uniref:Uncharacterized protein n=1 Tax=Musa acuminata TaxID=4641 RepID=Q1EPD0_MUSAC|nr:hypothetical protein MA4_42M13.4 [Musa acuminata]
METNNFSPKVHVLAGTLHPRCVDQHLVVWWLRGVARTSSSLRGGATYMARSGVRPTSPPSRAYRESSSSSVVAGKHQAASLPIPSAVATSLTASAPPSASACAAVLRDPASGRCSVPRAVIRAPPSPSPARPPPPPPLPRRPSKPCLKRRPRPRLRRGGHSLRLRRWAAAADAVHCTRHHAESPTELRPTATAGHPAVPVYCSLQMDGDGDEAGAGRGTSRQRPTAAPPIYRHKPLTITGRWPRTITNSCQSSSAAPNRLGGTERSTPASGAPETATCRLLNLSCQSLTVTCRAPDAPKLAPDASGSPDGEHRTVRCSPDSNSERKTIGPHTGHVPPDAQACVRCLASSVLP